MKDLRVSDVKIVLVLLSALLFLFGCSDQGNKPTLSPEEFMRQVNKCTQAGGKPVPIYDKDDPIKVYRIECHR